VTPADQVGGGMNLNFVVENHASGVTVSKPTYDESSRTIRMAVLEVARQIGNNEGEVWRAMKGSTNVRPAGLS
jgi:hypothetical protein